MVGDLTVTVGNHNTSVTCSKALRVSTREPTSPVWSTPMMGKVTSSWPMQNESV